MPILRDPNKMRELDALIMETTYGDRLHSQPDGDTDLASIINRVCERGGKIIIPSFAIGRTQQLVYDLHKLFDQNRIPNLPIFIDSPLACNATDVFRSHPECFDRETYRLFLREKDDPFGFGKLEYVRDVDDSKALNQQKDPHIIISASGMCEAGRILHHLKNNIGESKNLILFVGYAAEHTLARKIMDGNKKVRIFHDEYKVRAEIQQIDYFSGHADSNELMDYLQFIWPNRCKNIFLVHGEEDQALPFMEKLKNNGYENVQYPTLGQKFEI
jgi:metallo-beta-lactamase family protein